MHWLLFIEGRSTAALRRQGLGIRRLRRESVQGALWNTQGPRPSAYGETLLPLDSHYLQASSIVWVHLTSFLCQESAVL